MLCRVVVVGAFVGFASAVCLIADKGSTVKRNKKRRPSLFHHVCVWLKGIQWSIGNRRRTHKREREEIIGRQILAVKRRGVSKLLCFALGFGAKKDLIASTCS